MKRLYNKFRTSETLSLSELLKLKVTFVLFFLLIFVVLTFPITIFEDFGLEIRFLLPVSFLVAYLLSVILMFYNKVRWSMHLTIIIFIALTVYFLSGGNQLFGYLFLFISLVIIVFYFDLYTYLLYGGLLTVYGVFYINQNGVFLMGDVSGNLVFSNIVFQFVLIAFYLVLLLLFILSESTYEQLNRKYELVQNRMQTYINHMTIIIGSDFEKKNKKELHKCPDFQKVMNELSVFLSELLSIKKVDFIEEVVEFYFFIHDYDIEEITGKNPNSTSSKYAKEFSKYLIKEDSILLRVYYNVLTQLIQASKIDKKRYETNIETLFSNQSNRIVALAMIYKYLRSEKTQIDKWGKIEKSYSHDEILMLLNSKPYREFFTFEDVNFIINHQDLFEKHFR